MIACMERRYVLGLGEKLHINEDKGDELLRCAYPGILKLINSPETDDIEKVYAKFVIGAYYYFGIGRIESDYKKAFENH